MKGTVKNFNIKIFLMIIVFLESMFNFIPLSVYAEGTYSVQAPADSAPAWKDAGKFVNTDLAFKYIQHSGNYYYILQKDNDNVKLVRYEDTVGAENIYPEDDSFNAFDLTDEKGSPISFSNTEFTIKDFKVAGDGNIYVWMRDSEGSTVYDNLYSYNGSGKCIKMASYITPPGPEITSVSGIQVTSDGNLMVQILYGGNDGSWLSYFVYDERGNIVKQLNGKSIDALRVSDNRTNFSNIAAILPNIGVNTSDTLGMLYRYVIYVNNEEQVAPYYTALTIDKNLDESSIKTINFPKPESGYTIKNMIPTSTGVIVMEQGSSNEIKVYEYGISDDNDSSPIWSSGFTMPSGTDTSTLSGIETDPAVYSYSSDGSTIYVEGLEGSQTVERGTYSFQVDDSGTLTKYTGKSSDVTVPNTVKNIGAEAFKGNDSIENVIIPSNVTSIGDSAFENCNALKTVTVPAGVTQIGENAFPGGTDFVIVGVPGSEAENYAKANGITFRSVGGSINKIRLGGADRYATAVEISKASWNSSDTAVIASGQAFADALSAAPLAKQLDAPILLTTANTLNPNTEAELKRLGVKNVYIIGGTGSVSQNVENYIENNMKISVKQRVWGQDRYATSLAVAKLMNNPTQVFVASGSGYADSLSAASYAAASGSPILLSGQKSMSSDELRFIHSIDGKVYVIGGTGVIDGSVVSSIPEFDLVRLGGTDRYDTNMKVLNEFSGEYDMSNVYLASGAGFADALSGSVAAGKQNAPIVLVSQTNIDSVNSYVESIIAKVNNVNILGGQASVSDDIVDQVLK